MRAPLAIATLAALIAIASCTGTGQNTVDLFTVRNGSVTLTAEVPEANAAEISSVEFRVDGTPISTDPEGPEWSVQFDTATVADGVHYITAVGNPGGNELVLLENSIIVRNNAAGAGTGTVPAAGEQPAVQYKK
jgi:hypothetical protein